MAKAKNVNETPDTAEAPPERTGGVAIAKKVTMKTLGLTKEVLQSLVLADKNKDHKVARIIGRATRVMVKESDMGPSLAIKGTFRGVNLMSGEVINAATCFLPSAAADLVEGAFAGQEGNRTIDFAFDVTVRYDSRAATSYVFGVESLIAPDPASDPLARIAASLPKLPIGIAAPK